MFVARGIAVSSSIFLLVYVVLSLAVSWAWRRMRVRELAPRLRADLLFTLRMLPVMAAAAVTAAFTVPSFVLLEPRSIEEPLGRLPLALGACGIGLALVGAARAAAALIRAARLIALWTCQSQAAKSHFWVPVLRIDGTAPALTAAGILRPRVLLSAAAQSVLNENELRTALRHEVAHLRRQDNLKKLLLRFVAFPGMKTMETAWLESTEMAADDAAVRSVGEALDLAAALIKLSQIGPSSESSPELMTAFVHGSAALTNARVERLIAWSEDRSPVVGKHSPWHAIGLVLALTVAMTAAFALSYSALLARVHTATEWLVR